MTDHIDAYVAKILDSASGDWRSCLGALAAEFTRQGKRHVFAAFYAGTHLRRADDGAYVLVAANAFAGDWIAGHHLREVRAAIARALHLASEPAVRVEWPAPAVVPAPRAENTWSRERAS